MGFMVVSGGVSHFSEKSSRGPGFEKIRISFLSIATHPFEVSRLHIIVYGPALEIPSLKVSKFDFGGMNTLSTEGTKPSTVNSVEYKVSVDLRGDNSLEIL